MDKPKSFNGSYDDLCGNSKYNVAIYLRLSVEDEINISKRSKSNPFKNESASIENQRDILTQYVNLRGWNITGIYADDGYSGGNFERPGFQTMLKDAETGIINLILVKDLSRFGRDHIEVDHFVEDVLPLMGVRFIALMDGIDSEKGTEILPFHSLMNDYYLKDISRKIKSTFHVQAKAGNYIGWFVAYGYKKDPAKHGRLMIDPYAANVVNRIFNLRMQGLSYSKIAGALNADGISSPRNYCFQSEGKPIPFKVMNVWRESTVKRIIDNEVYLGHSLKMKTEAVSYKKKKRVNRPSDEWIRVENTHEAIILQEIWDAVHAVNLKKYDSNTVKVQEPSLFGGLLECENCHCMSSGMDNQRYNGKVKRYRYYYCSLHKQSGYTNCSWHTISELALMRIIREDMVKQLEHIEIDENRVVTEIQNQLTETSLAHIEKELQRLSAKLVKLDDYGTKLYEDRLKGIINLNTFIALSTKVDIERSEAQVKYENLLNSYETVLRQIYDIECWIYGIRSYLSLEMPDRAALCRIIDKIVIGECESNNIDKSRRQAVKIIYRFAGFIS